MIRMTMTGNGLLEFSFPFDIVICVVLLLFFFSFLFCLERVPLPENIICVADHTHAK